MRVFLNKWFARFARRQRLDGAALVAAVKEIERGLVDADLGGGVIKKRIPKPGRGKSGGYRTILIVRRGDRAFFVFGFEKSTKANLDPGERDAYRALAPILLGLSDEQLDDLVARGEMKELKDAEQDP